MAARDGTAGPRAGMDRSVIRAQWSLTWTCSPWSSPSSSSPPTPSPRPITESVEKVIDRLEEERKDPCLKAARENVPCFPVKTEEKGFDASVREGLGILGPAEKPTPEPAAHRRRRCGRIGPGRPRPRPA